MFVGKGRARICRSDSRMPKLMMEIKEDFESKSIGLDSCYSYVVNKIEHFTLQTNES